MVNHCTGYVSMPTWQQSEILMSFNEYLISKKIDAGAFKMDDPVRYTEWERLFDKMSPESFTVHKKFLLNTTRRKYLLR
jgi:hypothetical protein